MLVFRGGYLAEIKSSEEQAVLDGLLPQVRFFKMILIKII